MVESLPQVTVVTIRQHATYLTILATDALCWSPTGDCDAYSAYGTAPDSYHRVIVKMYGAPQS